MEFGHVWLLRDFTLYVPIFFIMGWFDRLWDGPACFFRVDVQLIGIVRLSVEVRTCYDLTSEKFTLLATLWVQSVVISCYGATLFINI